MEITDEVVRALKGRLATITLALRAAGVPTDRTTALALMALGTSVGEKHGIMPERLQEIALVLGGAWVTESSVLEDEPPPRKKTP